MHKDPGFIFFFHSIKVNVVNHIRKTVKKGIIIMINAKKLVALGLVGATALSMAACGNNNKEETPNVQTSSVETMETTGNANTGLSSEAETTATVPTGVYTAVSAEMAGVQVDMNEIVGEDKPFTIELKENGKATIQADGQDGKGKYTVDGNQVSLSILGADMKGTYENNSITFENMLDMGVNITFGLEGTDATNPENYITDEAKAIVGSWKSTGVTDVLGDEVDIAADALTLDFTADGNVTGSFNGETFGPFSWDTTLGLMIDSEDPSFLINENEDGSLEVSFSKGDEYYVFNTVKQ